MWPRLKKCPKCGIIKTLSLFSKQASKASGYHSYCKECNKTRARESVLAGGHLASRARYKARHPDRYRADRILWSMKMRGNDLQGLTRESIISDMSAGLHCPYCSEALGIMNLSYDHRDGRGSKIHPVCVECNLFKNIIHHDDFLNLISVIGHERLMFYRDKIKRAGRPFGHKLGVAA